MRIRPPTVADAPTLRMVAMKYATGMYPEMIAEIDKVHWLVKSCIHESQAHYCRVVGKEGEPKAAILTRTENNLWATKKHAVVLLWYSEIPGIGWQLLRGFRKWVDENKDQIVLAGFQADWVSTNKAPFVIARRVGFKERGQGAYCYFPRVRFA